MQMRSMWSLQSLPACGPQPSICTVPDHCRRKPRAIRSKAAQTDTSKATETSSQEQAVPAHVIQQLRRLEQEVQQAYQAGFNAGYTAGVKVTVNVDVDTPFSSSSRQRQESSTSLPSSRSNKTADSQQQQQLQGQGLRESSAAAASAANGDSLLRSAVKGLVWRVFSTTATVSIALLVLHDVLQVEDALKIGALEFIAKYVLYFVHERIWAMLPLL